MSTYEFKLPDIGEGVTEGEIVKWLVAQGEAVQEDQPMVEVMTDKATVTITAPKSGTIAELRGQVGQTVPVHSVLVVFDLAGGAVAAPDASTGPALAKKDDGPAATAVGDIRESLPGMSLLQKPSAPAPVASNGHAVATSYFSERPLATPATRKLARDLGIDLRTVAPTGTQGRVTNDDVRRSQAAPASNVDLRSNAAAPAAAQAAAQQQQAPSAHHNISPEVDLRSNISASRPAAAVSSTSEDQRQPLRGVRKRIFEGMSRSKHTAAHFTFVEECDATALIALRERLKPAADKAGVKLTFLPFITKAVVAALKKNPSLNSAFDETTNEIVTRGSKHIGIATSTESGLIVPVVRDADRKSILDIARDIQRLGEDAKNGKVRPDDLGGSTFTITSLGAQGGLFATPILNFPEVGILGVHRIKERPVVKNGQIVIGNVMLLSLSFDHRIIDGHVGAAFAYDIIGFLEDPDRLFLEMA